MRWGPRTCRLRLTAVWLLMAMSAFGFFVRSGLCAPLGRGIGSSFLGGLVFALAAIYAGFSLEVFKSGLSLVLFMALLLPLSWASHRYLEMPAQGVLRRAWHARPAAA
jgi:hypothetical protein